MKNFNFRVVCISVLLIIGLWGACYLYQLLYAKILESYYKYIGSGIVGMIFALRFFMDALLGITLPLIFVDGQHLKFCCKPRIRS